MKYTIAMKALTKPDAAAFGKALARYDIDITQPDLFARWERLGEKRIKLDKVGETIELMIQKDIKDAADRGEVLEPDPEDYKPDWFELDFQFVGVSGERLAVAEHMASVFFRLNQWEPQNIVNDASYRQGCFYADQHGKMPPATWQASRQASRLHRFGVPRSLSRRLSKMFYA